MTPRRGAGDGDPDGFRANLRRARFQRRLRRRREEEPLPGTVPRLGPRQRRLIRALLAKPDEPWPLGAIWYTFLLMPMTVAELAEQLSRANLGYLRWIDGRRCLVLTEFGVAELPGILELYRSQAPLAVLVRRGPRAAGVVWWLRHRERVGRRRHRHELPDGGKDDENKNGDSGLLW